MKEHAGDIDFAVQPELLELCFLPVIFGRYANEKGDMMCLLYL